MTSAYAADIRQWLLTGTGEMRFGEEIFGEMCNRFLAAGVPIARASLHLVVNNPQCLGARIIWWKATGRAEMHTVGYEVQQSDAYERSPFGAIRQGARVVRQRVDREAVADMTPALLEELDF